MPNIGSTLRSLRKEKGLSLMELSKKAGCSISYLSMVENGKVNPSVSKLKKITDVLGITIIELFYSQGAENYIIRREKRIKGDFSGSKVRVELLVPQISNRKIDARLAIIEVGGSSEGYYRHPGEEFGFVIKGEFELKINGVSYLLREGDSFYFPSTKDHSFRNPSKEQEAVVLWVNHPPTW